MRYDEDDEYYRREYADHYRSIGMTRAHDRYLDPPDDAECPECEEKQIRIDELQDCMAWLLAHRLYWFATQPGAPVRCALMPYTNGDTVCDAPTQREAAEKLWHEHR